MLETVQCIRILDIEFVVCLFLSFLVKAKNSRSLGSPLIVSHRDLGKKVCGCSRQVTRAQFQTSKLTGDAIAVMQHQIANKNVKSEWKALAPLAALVVLVSYI